MTLTRYRRPLLIMAATLAVLSVVAVGTVMTMAANHVVAPAWITAVALYGLPLAFILMLALVAYGVVARRRPHRPGER